MPSYEPQNEGFDPRLGPGLVRSKSASHPRLRTCARRAHQGACSAEMAASNEIRPFLLEVLYTHPLL
jgi:hypothetical protein